MYDFLAGIISSINHIVGNYGIAIILFTTLIRVLIFPLNLKSRESMRKVQVLQPKLQALQKKYANDKEKLNLKTSELYKKEGTNPLSGCLPMLLSFPILIIMFGAMRQVANEQLISQVFAIISGGQPKLEGFLWIKNLWMPDSPFYPAAPTIDILKTIPADLWQKSFNALTPDVQASINAIIPNLDFFHKEYINILMNALSENANYISSVAVIPNLSNINFMITKLSVFTHYNGWLLLPILAAVTQFFTTQLTPQQPVAEGQPNSGAFMKWFFPLFSLYICLTYNASFALYWVMANILAGVETIAINKFLDKKDSQLQVNTEEGLIK